MEEKVKNILLILPEFEPQTSGGICAYYKNLLTEFQFRNLEYNFTIIQGNASESIGGTSNWNGIKILYLDEKDFRRRKKNFYHLNIFPELRDHIASAWAMYDTAERLNIDYDLVITTDWGLGFLPWIIVNKTPINIHLHGSIGQIDYYDKRPGLELFSNLYLQIESDLFNYANRLITHSNENIKFWEKRLVKGELFKLVAPCFHKREVTTESTLIHSPYKALVLARIQYWKGPIELCEAIRKKPLDRWQDFKIYWAGRDTIFFEKEISMNSYLLNTYPDIWGHIIIPIGNKSKEEIQDIYKEIDFAIVPSTWDMFNMAAVEHLLNNKPLICSVKAGVSEFIKDLETVTIVHDIETLAMAIADNLNYLRQSSTKNIVNNKTDLDRIFDNNLTVEAHQATFINQKKLNKVNIDLSYKYNWLTPSINSNIDSQNKILEFWPLKKTINAIGKRIRKKIKF